MKNSNIRVYNNNDINSQDIVLGGKVSNQKNIKGVTKKKSRRLSDSLKNRSGDFMKLFNKKDFKKKYNLFDSKIKQKQKNENIEKNKKKKYELLKEKIKKNRSLDFELTNITEIVKITKTEEEIIRKLSIKNLKDLFYKKEIGKGSTCKVYKGTYENEIVCIKELLPIKKINERYYKSFLKEIANMSKLNHKNCLRLLKCYDDFKKTIIVTPYYSHGTLREIIMNQKEILKDEKIKYKIILQIANGLNYLHDNLFIHCDIKSLNIILNENLDAVICDFGFLLKLKEYNEILKISNPKGTIFWMPPETLNQDNSVVSIKTDIWAFGITCWELWALSKPYPNFNSLDVIELLPQKKIALKIDENWDQKIKNVISKCLRFDPNDRPNMKEILQILKE